MVYHRRKIKLWSREEEEEILIKRDNLLLSSVQQPRVLFRFRKGEKLNCVDNTDRTCGLKCQELNRRNSGVDLGTRTRGIFRQFSPPEESFNDRDHFLSPLPPRDNRGANRGREQPRLSRQLVSRYRLRIRGTRTILPSSSRIQVAKEIRKQTYPGESRSWTVVGNNSIIRCL